MLPIAICDDEPMHRQRTAAVLQEKIAGYGPALRLFASSAELLNAVETEGYAPRIAVLDIQMQEMDGISLAREPSVSTAFRSSADDAHSRSAGP